MDKIIDMISARVSRAFEAAGYDPALGQVTLSNRPDLCQYQCNGAMAGAKQYHKAPFLIAQAVVDNLAGEEMFSKAEMVKPGFINLDVSGAFLARVMNEMNADERRGVERAEHPLSIVVDYGGPNVAKPLHVGHLRSAVIGESIKRTARFMGHKVVGDVHLGDWGLQIGQIITELKERQPGLPYFDPEITEGYPAEPPFTISDLEEIYPCASKKSKEDEAFKAAAQAATAELQAGRPGYRALWRNIIDVSVADLKRNYEKLDVSFDLWMGESDAQPYIPAMVEQMKADGYAYVSDGALVVDVAEEGDKVEVPPCLILKSDGAAQYETTDLATIVQRRQDFDPDRIIYLTDKRQELHFVRVFRCAYKTGLVDRDKCSLEHIGFGTMNGKDGKPFKTRAGGVMRLETLIAEITDFIREKITENQTVSDDELEKTAGMIALAALKYGDLSNLATKDYVFDLDRFASFEGNTGPYILYTIVRIKSILAKYDGDVAAAKLLAPTSQEQKDLMLVLSRLQDSLLAAYRDSLPNVICAYIYELAGAANKFYHDVRIISEPDPAQKASYVALMDLTRRALETCIDLLGFSAPDKM